MKFTLGWLKSHLDTTASLKEITDRLTAIGLELEGVADPAAKLAPFTVAYVVEAKRHPDADRLHLLRPLGHLDRQVRRPLQHAVRPSHRGGAHALLRGALIGVARRHEQAIDVAAEPVLLLRVGDGGAEHFLHVARHGLLRVLERRERAIHVLAANQREHEARLLRRGAHVARRGRRFDHG